VDGNTYVANCAQHVDFLGCDSLQHVVPPNQERYWITEIESTH